MGYTLDWLAWFKENAMYVGKLVAFKWNHLKGREVGSEHYGFSSSSKDYDSIWIEPVFQYSFMKRLLGLDKSMIVEYLDRNQYGQLEIRFNAAFKNNFQNCWADSIIIGNSAGRPWIQYWFSKSLFYRLDWLSTLGGWTLVLREYNDDRSQKDLKRIKAVQDLCMRVSNRHPGLSIRRNDYNLGSNEISLCYLDLSKSAGLSRFSRMHDDLVTALLRARLLDV